LHFFVSDLDKLRLAEYRQDVVVEHLAVAIARRRTMAGTRLPPPFNDRLEAVTRSGWIDKTTARCISPSADYGVERLATRCVGAERNLATEMGDSRLPTVSHPTNRSRSRPSHGSPPIERAAPSRA
jgi:hypothetical protein